jgi:hypothetical protein
MCILKAGEWTKNWIRLFLQLLYTSHSEIHLQKGAGNNSSLVVYREFASIILMDTQEFSLEEVLNLFNIIFELVYINNMREFHCDNSILVYSVLWTSLPPPLLYLPFSNSIWWVSLCYLHVYIWRALQSSSPIRISSFPLLPPLILPDFTFTFMSYYLHHHHIIINTLDLGSINEQEHAIFGFLSLAYPTW